MDRSSLVLSDNFLRECRTGWLLIEDGFGGRLNEKEKLKYGKMMHTKFIPISLVYLILLTAFGFIKYIMHCCLLILK